MYQKKHQHILTHLQEDPVLNRLCDEVREAGPFQFVESTKTIYHDLLEAIVYQQVSIKAAKSVFNRLKQGIGKGLTLPGELLKIDHRELKTYGLSRQKASYLLNIAHFFHEHRLHIEDLDTMEDQQIIELLTQIKGVGRWTVKMILISSLGRPDVFPYEDLGIQQAMMECYEFQAEKKTLFGRMNSIASPWSPYRTYASLILWRWKRIQMGIDY